MSDPRQSYSPFSVRWFIQRSGAAIREKRMPDPSLFILRLKALWNRSYAGPVEFTHRQPEELLPPATFASARPFEVRPLDSVRPPKINTYFSQVYVISPHSNSESRLTMARKLSTLGISAKVIEFNDYAGEVAGHHGLLAVLEDAIENGYGRILLLSDRVLFARDFHSSFEQAAAIVPPAWKLLYLGARQRGWTAGEDLEFADKTVTLDTGTISCYHPITACGYFALGIHQDLYRPLIDKFRAEASFVMGETRQLHGVPTESCFALFPSLVIEPEDDIDPAAYRWDVQDYDPGPSPDLVSVIMPAYNAERTIEKSIRSILNQTYRTLELIVSDDGSTDGTREVVRRLMAVDNRLKLVESSRNQGCYFARNDAIRASSGNYIAVQDSDDISFPQRLERQLVPMATGNAEFTLAWVLRSRLKMEELEIGDVDGMVKKVLANRRTARDGTYGYWDRPILGLMTSVYKRSLFEEMGLFWEYRFGSDAEFLERVLFRRTGRTLSKDGPNIHSLLLNTSEIAGIYKRVDEILLISAEMGEQNITNNYKKKQLEEFITRYRAKYAGESDYSYPELKK